MCLFNLLMFLVWPVSCLILRTHVNGVEDCCLLLTVPCCPSVLAVWIRVSPLFFRLRLNPFKVNRLTHFPMSNVRAASLSFPWKHYMRQVPDAELFWAAVLFAWLDGFYSWCPAVLCYVYLQSLGLIRLADSIILLNIWFPSEPLGVSFSGPCGFCGGLVEVARRQQLCLTASALESRVGLFWQFLLQLCALSVYVKIKSAKRN